METYHCLYTGRIKIKCQSGKESRVNCLMPCSSWILETGMGPSDLLGVTPECKFRSKLGVQLDMVKTKKKLK